MPQTIDLIPPRRSGGYRCSELARIIGKHPNTLRSYETWGFLSKVPRKDNGYRSYSRRHALEALLTTIALRSNFQEWPGRKPILSLIRHAVAQHYEKALADLESYAKLLREAQAKLDQAREILENWKNGEQGPKREIVGRWHAAKLIGVSPDTLRDWERNGLIHPYRKQNQRRCYRGIDLDRLLVIKVLREGGYSLMGILNLFTGCNHAEDLRFARDCWQDTLTRLKNDTKIMKKLLRELNQGSNPR